MKRAVLCFPHVNSRRMQYPTGLYKIATWCADEYEIIVLDERQTPDMLSCIGALLDDGNMLCVGFSVMTGEQIMSAVRLSQALQGRIPIVWGGVHPTLLPEETLANDYVDYVVAGEGEEPFLELLRFLDGRSVTHGKFGSKDSSVAPHNYLRRLPGCYVDFDRYPIHSDYIISRDGFSRAFTLETSRGCPYRCAFCHNSSYPTPYRSMDAQQVLQLGDNLQTTYKLDGIVFQEDNFFAQPSRATAVAEGLGSRPHVGWKANGRIDHFLRYGEDPGYLRLLVDSGCRVLQFGVESGSERILRLAKKGLHLNDVHRVNRSLAQYPIRVRYNFIIGFPTETREEIEQTVSLAKQLHRDNNNVDPPFMNIYTPYPGTPLYREAVKLGFRAPRRTEDWADLRWNRARGSWLPLRMRRFLERKSQEHWEASRYLL